MAVAATDARRQARLRAMDVVPYRLRGAGPVEAVEAVEEDASPATAAAQPLPCVLLLPQACAAPALDRIGRAMAALGADFAHAPRIQVPAAGLRQVPPRARAYLAFGEAQARALGQVLSAAEARQVEVVLLDAPDALGQGAAKQRLWQAVKSLRARLAIN